MIKALKVLVVDYSPTMRRIISNMLIQLGCKNFILSEETRDACKKLKEDGEISFIILRWNMPTITGRELTQFIRRVEDSGIIRKNIPILMVAVPNMKEEITDALAMGVNDYIDKPFTAAELRGKIEGIMSELIQKSIAT